MAVTYPCKRCKAQVAFKDVHYANNGRDTLCTLCYEVTIKKQTLTEKPKEIQKTISGKSMKEKYVCVKCRYNFMYSLSEAVLRCPLCSNTEVLKDDYNAEKLLKEAMEWR
ncbi:MAG: hypothetical protein AABX82_00060 [Nanoarchaeota archaeon]